jgi:tetratricopeptide (TPR) repeat protein
MKWADESVSLAQSPGGRSSAYLERGDVHFLKGALGDAMADCNRAVEAAQTDISYDKAWAFEGKGFIHLTRGEYEAARRSFESMRVSLAEYSKDISPLNRIEVAFDMGMLALRQGQTGQVEAGLSEIRSLLPEIVKELQPDYQLRHDLLQGEMLLVQGKLDEALTYANRACGPDSPNWRRGNSLYLPQAYYMDLAARIYARKGDVGQAISEYERLLVTNYSTGFQFPVHPLYHFRLGLLYKRANEALKARSQFERFLDLWKDADSGIPEVEDARKRLAGLKAQ